MNIEDLKKILFNIDNKIDYSKIDENTKLVEDLGFDSLKLLEFYTILEEKGISIIEKSRSFEDLNRIKLIINLINNSEFNI